jgi:RNA polymerase subunit RPABC4/transcription elongation factor Spt4
MGLLKKLFNKISAPLTDNARKYGPMDIRTLYPNRFPHHLTDFYSCDKETQEYYCQRDPEFQKKVKIVPTTAEKPSAAAERRARIQARAKQIQDALKKPLERGEPTPLPLFHPGTNRRMEVNAENKLIKDFRLGKTPDGQQILVDDQGNLIKRGIASRSRWTPYMVMFSIRATNKANYNGFFTACGVCGAVVRKSYDTCPRCGKDELHKCNDIIQAIKTEEEQAMAGIDHCDITNPLEWDGVYISTNKYGQKILVDPYRVFENHTMEQIELGEVYFTSEMTRNEKCVDEIIVERWKRYPDIYLKPLTLEDFKDEPRPEAALEKTLAYRNALLRAYETGSIHDPKKHP